MQEFPLDAAWKLWCSNSLTGMQQHFQTDRKVLAQLESLNLIHSGAIGMWMESHIHFSLGRRVQILHQETCCMKRPQLNEKTAMHSVAKQTFHTERKRVSWMLTSKSQVFLLPRSRMQNYIYGYGMRVGRIPLILQGRGTENTKWANGCHKEVQPQAATVLLR